MKIVTIDRFAEIMFKEDKLEDKLNGIHVLSNFESFRELSTREQEAYIKEAVFYLGGNGRNNKKKFPKFVLKKLNKNEIEYLRKENII